MIVERAVWDDFRPRLVEAVAALRLGDPEDETTDVGPLPEGPARARARAALAEARERGGEVVVGEGERGALFTPTIVRLPRAALDVGLWREESFAPLRGLVLADDAEDALALANDTPYGLGAALFGGEPGARERVVAGLRAARVLVDEGPLYQDPHLVVGGVGDSGTAGARPKIEQLVFARRVHRAGGWLGQHAQVLPVDEGLEAGAAELAAHARAAPPGVGGVGHHHPPAVDHDGPRAERLGGLERRAQVASADVVHEPVVGAVGLGEGRGGRRASP